MKIMNLNCDCEEVEDVRDELFQNDFDSKKHLMNTPSFFKS